MTAPTGEKPHVCGECGRSFGFLTAYRRHLVTHSDARPFKCDLCEKTFRLRATLKNHARDAHADVARYACTVCGARYRHRFDLRNHMEKHTGRTRFAHRCAVCARKFVTLENMEAHMQQKHGFSVRENDEGEGEGGVCFKEELEEDDGEQEAEVAECGEEVSVQWECVVDGSF